MILGGSNMPTVILTEAAAYEVKDMLASMICQMAI